jgi:hypothetical protein
VTTLIITIQLSALAVQLSALFFALRGLKRLERLKARLQAEQPKIDLQRATELTKMVYAPRPMLDQLPRIPSVDLPKPSESTAPPLPVEGLPMCAACGDDASVHYPGCTCWNLHLLHAERKCQGTPRHAFTLAPDDMPTLCCICYHSDKTGSQLAAEVCVRRAGPGNQAAIDLRAERIKRRYEPEPEDE